MPRHPIPHTPSQSDGAIDERPAPHSAPLSSENDLAREEEENNPAGSASPALFIGDETQNAIAPQEFSGNMPPGTRAAESDIQYHAAAPAIAPQYSSELFAMVNTGLPQHFLNSLSQQQNMVRNFFATAIDAALEPPAWGRGNHYSPLHPPGQVSQNMDTRLEQREEAYHRWAMIPYAPGTNSEELHAPPALDTPPHAADNSYALLGIPASRAPMLWHGEADAWENHSIQNDAISVEPVMNAEASAPFAPRLSEADQDTETNDAAGVFSFSIQIPMPENWRPMNHQGNPAPQANDLHQIVRCNPYWEDIYPYKDWLGDGF